MKIYINEKEIMLNLIKNITILEVAYSLGIYIPYFCSNTYLLIAGNCRMCLIEVFKLNKPMISCLNLCFDQLKIYTNSFKLLKLRENVLEFLLVNHPLDCPICDQGGECDLQEQTIYYGLDLSRFLLNKRSVNDNFINPFIKTILNRCILCLRCIRFLNEYSSVNILGLIGRGIKTKISTYILKSLDYKFSTNIVDLCPVGIFIRKFSRNLQIKEEISKIYFYNKFQLEFNSQFLNYYKAYNLILDKVRFLNESNKLLYSILELQNFELLIVNIPRINIYTNIKSEKDGQFIFFNTLYKSFDNKFYKLVHNFTLVYNLIKDIQYQNILLKSLLFKKKILYFFLNNFMLRKQINPLYIVRFFCSGIKKRGRKKLLETKKQRLIREKLELVIFTKNKAKLDLHNKFQIFLNLFLNNIYNSEIVDNLRSIISKNNNKGIFLKFDWTLKFPQIMYNLNDVNEDLDIETLNPFEDYIEGKFYYFEDFKDIIHKYLGIYEKINLKSKKKGVIKDINYKKNLFINSSTEFKDLMQDKFYSSIFLSSPTDNKNIMLYNSNYNLGVNSKLIIKNYYYFEIFKNLRFSFKKINYHLVVDRTKLLMPYFFLNFNVLKFNFNNNFLSLYLKFNYDNDFYLFFSGFNLYFFDDFIKELIYLQDLVDLDKLVIYLSKIYLDFEFDNLKSLDSMLILNLKSYLLYNYTNFMKLHYQKYESKLKDILNNKDIQIIDYKPYSLEKRLVYLSGNDLILNSHHIPNFLKFFNVISFEIFFNYVGLFVKNNLNENYLLVYLNDLISENLSDNLLNKYKNYSSLFLNVNLDLLNNVDKNTLILINIETKFYIVYNDYLEIQNNYDPILIESDNQIELYSIKDLVKKVLKKGRKMRNKMRSTRFNILSKLLFNSDLNLSFMDLKIEIDLDDLKNLDILLKKMNIQQYDDGIIIDFIEDDENDQVIIKIPINDKENNIKYLIECKGKYNEYILNNLENSFERYLKKKKEGDNNDSSSSSDDDDDDNSNNNENNNNEKEENEENSIIGEELNLNKIDLLYNRKPSKFQPSKKSSNDFDLSEEEESLLYFTDSDLNYNDEIEFDNYNENFKFISPSEEETSSDGEINLNYIKDNKNIIQYSSSDESLKDSEEEMTILETQQDLLFRTLSNEMLGIIYYSIYEIKIPLIELDNFLKTGNFLNKFLNTFNILKLDYYINNIELLKFIKRDNLKFRIFTHYTSKLQFESVNYGDMYHFYQYVDSFIKNNLFYDLYFFSKVSNINDYIEINFYDTTPNITEYLSIILNTVKTKNIDLNTLYFKIYILKMIDNIDEKNKFGL